MESTSRIVHLAPADQPTSVHEIACRLFPSYTVDEGSMHLAGCLLEDRLFARLEPPAGTAEGDIYIDRRGKQVPEETVEQLGMRTVTGIDKPTRPFEQQLEEMVGIWRYDQGPDAPQVTAQPLWCKWVEGVLRFSVGQVTADLPFSGWARSMEPPPYICPYTGKPTFDLAMTDDGRLVAADEIAACEVSGKRVLRSELVECEGDGRRVLEELTQICPVSDQRVLIADLVACGQCRQRVAPQALHHGLCQACRKLAPVGKADPRMARLLDEHPLLDGWRSWRIAETANVYVLVAAGWVKKLLVVADKESLVLREVASSGRFNPSWDYAKPDQFELFLRG